MHRPLIRKQAWPQRRLVIAELDDTTQAAFWRGLVVGVALCLAAWSVVFVALVVLT